jgi:hypothetical protein
MPKPDEERRNTSVRHVVILDEAQIVVGTGGSAVPTDDIPSASSHSSEYVSRFLMEGRGYGEAFVLGSPIASRVAPEAMKGTRTKVGFGQVDGQERDVMANTMLLGPVETEEITRLSTGEAYILSDNQFRATKIRTINILADCPHIEPPTDNELLALITDQEWFVQAANRRLVLEMDLLVERGLQLNRVFRETTGTARTLKKTLKYVLQSARPAAVRRQALQRIRTRVQVLLDSFDARCRSFQQDLYQYFADAQLPAGVDRELSGKRNQLIDQVEHGIKPTAARCRSVLKDLISCCEKPLVGRT